MPLAHINGTEIFYEQRGEGPPCIALHGGLGMDHQYLLRTLAPLEEQLRMIYLDHRGNGRSGRPPMESITMEQFADDAAGLLDELGIESAIIVGHSYGGFVAQEFALRHSGRLRALILVDTTPGQLGATETPDEEQGPPIPEGMVELMSTAPASDADLAGLMRRMLPYYFHAMTPDQAEPAMAGMVFSADAMVRGFEVLAGWSSVDRLPDITAPTLLLWGRHDLVCSLPQATRIANRLPDAEVRVFENSGHFPFVEEPRPFFEGVREWLTRKGLV